MNKEQEEKLGKAIDKMLGRAKKGTLLWFLEESQKGIIKEKKNE